MDSKKNVLAKTEKFSKNKKSFAYRVCKLLADEEFNGPLPSNALVQLLNEGPGKKIKTANLSASMQPLQKEDIIKVKNISNGKDQIRYWFPGWIDKKEAERNIASTADNVLFFTGENSWTDPNKNFPKVIDLLEGDLCIVDPFYGNGTFFVLEKFGKIKKNPIFVCSARQRRTTKSN